MHVFEKISNCCKGMIKNMIRLVCLVCLVFVISTQAVSAQENPQEESLSHTNDFLNFMLLSSFLQNSSLSFPCLPSDPLCFTSLFNGETAEGSGTNDFDNAVISDPPVMIELNGTDSEIPPPIILPAVDVFSSPNNSLYEETVYENQFGHQINGEFVPNISDQTLFDLSTNDIYDPVVDDNVENDDVEPKEFILQPLDPPPEILEFLRSLTSTVSVSTISTTSHSDVALTTESPQNTRQSDTRVPDANNSSTPKYNNTTTAFTPRQTVTSNISSKSISEKFDVSQCGVFPGCAVRYVTSQKFEITCDPVRVTTIVVFTALLSVVITLSNILIIVVTLRTKVLRKPHGYFKVSLAFSDLLAGGLVVPSMVNNMLTNINYDAMDGRFLAGFREGNSPYAIVFGSLGIMSSIVTLHSLLLLSVDRFLSVTWPMKYRIGDIMTPKRAVLLIAIVWILALIIAVLPILVVDYLCYGISYISFRIVPIIKPLKSNAEPTLSSRYIYSMVYVLFVWALPFVTTWMFTILTSIQSRRMLNHMRDARRSRRTSQTLDRADYGLRRTVTVVLILFTITVLPIFSVLVDSVVNPPKECTSKSSSLAYFSSVYVLICGSFLNVVVYNVCNGEFRAACKKLCGDVARCLCCCRNVDDVSLSSRRQKSLSYWRSSTARNNWQVRYGTNRSIPTTSETLSSKSRTFSANTDQTVSSSSHGSAKLSADRACSDASSVFSTR